MATLNTLIVVPFMGMVLKVASFIPTLISAFVILIAGLLMARVLRDVFHRICKEIKLDKLADKVGLSGILHKGGIKYKLSGIIGATVHLVTLIIFLMMTVEMMGVTVMSVFISSLIGYAYHVVTAVFVLVIGMILAKIVSTIVYAVASNLDLPNPKLHERITRWAVVLYAAKISIVELGLGVLFAGTTFHILFGGIVLGLALAFGLGGKDKAAGCLSKKK